MPVPQNGSITCSLAIYFHFLTTATSERTGTTAERTASAEKPTWSSSTPQRSRWVDAERVWIPVRHRVQTNTRFSFLFPQTFVSHHVETLVPGKAFWQNSFWLGIRDIEEEGTWVWINNVTEVEQRWENHFWTTSDHDSWWQLHFHYKGTGEMESPMTMDTSEKTVGLHFIVSKIPGRHAMMSVVDQLCCTGYVRKL